jgi:putative heme iron utilization protein
MSERKRGEPGVAEVRALLEAESIGLLSTTSVHRPGYPYGSLMPFALSAGGSPLLLLSDLAAHTKNLLADPRACLFVGDRTGATDADPLAGARVSLLGRATRVGHSPSSATSPASSSATFPSSAASTTVGGARARYLARHPRAAAYFELRDFGLWELAVEEARLISGFGSMRWLPFGS